MSETHSEKFNNASGVRIFFVRALATYDLGANMRVLGAVKIFETGVPNFPYHLSYHVMHFKGIL